MAVATAPATGRRWSHSVLAVLGIATIAVLFLQYSTPVVDVDHVVLLQASKQEFVRHPSHSIPAEADALIVPDYHVVFSTSCTPQQNWESMVFFYHAMKVNQPGNVTRIASGCSKKDAADLVILHTQHIQPMSDNFHLHLTPDYSRVRLSEGKHPYKYMNKPYGLRHWFEHELGLNENKTIPSPLRDGIVMLLDPDMILLRPLLHDFTNQNVIWSVPDGERPIHTVVTHGHPIAQHDGYLDNSWMKLNTSYITDQPPGSHVQLPNWNDGPVHWNTGPPYLATVADFYKIAVKWTEYAPRVLDVYPKLFAEMFGLIHATVQLQLPFALIKSIVVSTTETRDREGWAFIDAIPDEQICDPLNGLNGTHHPLPIGLHYCKRYFLGKWFFSKYRMKKNIMSCEKNLLRPPPRDLATEKIDYYIRPPLADLSDKRTYTEEHQPLASSRQAKREAFMLCGLVDSMNEALRYHKTHACGDSANLNESYTVYDDPTNN